MLFKLLVCTLVLCFSSAFGATLAGNIPTATEQQINKRINYLQIQINELRAEQKTQKKQKKNCFRNIVCYRVKEYNGEKYQQCHNSLLGIEPYLNKDTTAFDGSKLIINVPSVREDSQLLLQQYQLIQEYHRLGVPVPNLPRVTLTGKLEGNASYGNTYTDLQSGNINFSGNAEIGTYIQGNSWVSGYMSLGYGPADKHRNSSRLFMNRAFVTIGNLSQFPLYASIGQVYVPFGCYSSLMVTTPVTQALGRTRARTLTFGYQQTGNNIFHAEVYGFQRLTHNFSHRKNNEWGADIGYKFNNGSRVSGEIGAGYISSLKDSQWIQEMALKHRVPGLNIYGALAINPVILFAEYVGTVRSVDINDIGFANQKVPRPTAFNGEASYTLKTGSKPSSIGVSYGHTSQALALGLPQDRYSVFYNVNIWRETNLALEYRYDVYYSTKTILTNANSIPTTANVAINLGKSDNVITAQFDLFF